MVTHCVCMGVKLDTLRDRAEADKKGCGTKCGLCLPYLPNSDSIRS